MIRPVPAELATHYLNVMGISLTVNVAITMFLFGALLTPLAVAIVVAVTDFMWWNKYVSS
jgi:hypothetical protein